jgi:23S rRNA G2445 N2-methylase RlmL
MGTAYKACVHLRAALRVLHLLAVKHMDPEKRGYEELYAAVRDAAPWQELLERSEMTLGVQLRMRSCQGWNHSTAAQQCIQDAIADAVRDHGCVLAVSSLHPGDLFSVLVSCFLKDLVVQLQGWR